ncbi:unnamed protein product [Ophioblennius macclurei]
MSVLSSAGLHEQLSIIMGALTKAAVVEICELVDEGYAALQREISRSRKENDDLRKKLHLIESIVVRGGGGGGGGAVEAKEADGDPLAESAKRSQTPRQQRDGDGADAAACAPSTGRHGRRAAVVQEEFPDVVLIKDEDSNSNDTFEEASSKPADGGSTGCREVASSFPNSRQKRMSWPEKEDTERKSSADNPKAPKLTVGIQEKTMSVYSLDSPGSEPSCSGQLSGDVEVDAGSNRQVYFTGSALMESPSSRAELDMNVDQAWTKQAKGPMAFAQFHQSENMEGDSFGVKLISVSGSTSTDCQLSEGSNSAFEYEESEMMNYAMYGEQSGPSQLCNRQPGVRRKRFICSFCNKTYATAQNLDVHMRLHTGERPFSCSQCGKKFTQSAHLKSHLSVHSGERPFACSVCSKSFIVKYSLKLHMKKCHPNL